MRRIPVLVLLAALVVALLPAAAHGAQRPRYVVAEDQLPFTALPGATAYFGVSHRAGYRIEVPDDWNGSLVMWAHGFRGTGPELTVDDHPLRPLLISQGYAWAASSYTENDYNVGDGVESTRKLVQAFRRITRERRPDQVLITGASMGGHVTAASIERYGRLYDGAMPICGVLGDVELFDYFLDFNLAAQELGLGAGASTFPVDPLQYLGAAVPTIKANLEAAPGGWPNVLNVQGEQFKQLVENRSGGDRPNFDEAWSFWNTFPDFESGPGNFLFDLGATDGTLANRRGVVVDNTDTVYHLDTDLGSLTAEEVALNASIERVEADRRTRRPRGYEPAPSLTGDIDVPVLTLHNLGDLFVPFHNEVVYAQDVAASGNSDLLVQRAIRGVGHCDFSGSELATAFLDLVAWVDHGVEPEGDVLLDPAVVAGASYGCQFTDDPFDVHVLATPCP